MSEKKRREGERGRGESSRQKHRGTRGQQDREDCSAVEGVGRERGKEQRLLAMAMQVFILRQRPHKCRAAV